MSHDLEREQPVFIYADIDDGKYEAYRDAILGYVNSQKSEGVIVKWWGATGKIAFHPCYKNPSTLGEFARFLKIGIESAKVLLTNNMVYILYIQRRSLVKKLLNDDYILHHMHHIGFNRSNR